jgi:hypothetical protein
VSRTEVCALASVPVRSLLAVRVPDYAGRDANAISPDHGFTLPLGRRPLVFGDDAAIGTGCGAMAPDSCDPWKSRPVQTHPAVSSPPGSRPDRSSHFQPPRILGTGNLYPPTRSSHWTRWLAAGALLVLAGCTRPIEPVRSTPPAPPRPRTINFQPVWSPHDSLIAYVHLAQTLDERQKGDFQIWRYDLRTRSAVYVAPGSSPSWAPDSRHLIYINAGLLCVVDISAPGAAQPLSTVEPCLSPSWSPDSQHIAFETRYGDPVRASTIWTIGADGTHLLDISVHGTGEWKQPRWSPDGRWLLHMRYVSGVVGVGLFVMKSDGSSGIRLTNDNAWDESGAWHPDGNRIAWVRSQADGRYGVWTMRLDGTDKHLILPEAADPAWSPDGLWLAVAMVGPGDSNTVSVWITRPDGTEPVRLPLP